MKKKIGHLIICLTLGFLLTNLVSYMNEGSNNVMAGGGVTPIKGDIVFGDFTPLAIAFGAKTLYGYSNDHVVICGNFGYYWESAPYFPGINMWRGVQYTHKSILRLILTNFTVAKIPGASTSERNNMITFCQNQWKEDYQWSYPDDYRYESCFVNPDISASPPVTDPVLINRYSDAFVEYINEWHCAELVWAAWMHGANIDLDPSPYKEWGFCGEYADECSIKSYIITVFQLRDGCEEMGDLYPATI